MQLQVLLVDQHRKDTVDSQASGCWRGRRVGSERYYQLHQNDLLDAPDNKRLFFVLGLSPLKFVTDWRTNLSAWGPMAPQVRRQRSLSLAGALRMHAHCGTARSFSARLDSGDLNKKHGGEQRR